MAISHRDSERLIVLRSRMSLNERDALKVLAIREGRDMAALVADALRKTYNLGEK